VWVCVWCVRVGVCGGVCVGVCVKMRLEKQDIINAGVCAARYS
jgi:hypothetical protein